MGQFFVLTVGDRRRARPAWAAFGVLGRRRGPADPRGHRCPGSACRSTAPRRPPSSGAATRRRCWPGALAYDSPAHLAALLAAWGAVLGLAATRAGPLVRPSAAILFWLAVGFEIVGWWLFIALADVALPEAYTLPFAALALLVGIARGPAAPRPEQLGGVRAGAAGGVRPDHRHRAGHATAATCARCCCCSARWPR